MVMVLQYYQMASFTCNIIIWLLSHAVFFCISIDIGIAILLYGFFHIKMIFIRVLMVMMRKVTTRNHLDELKQ
jgi:hypothetical protein